ncbi:site-specific integrase [Sphingobacterium sp. HJSM2_6]|uniref:site-specific integrase n=1 Tax=Sphingobacterium sp. HJSM2_6 TaxID=3366264 RepID=UPI003BC06594
MINTNISINFFLKTSKKLVDSRFIYFRILVNGNSRETSTKKKWQASRWDQGKNRAIGTKEDARKINNYLDFIIRKIEVLAEELQRNGRNITAQTIIDSYNGKNSNYNLILAEFQKHNDELFALIPSGEVAHGTYDRYVTARSHVKDYIKKKYNSDDLEFQKLNFEFIKDYELYLKTVRGCNNNTTLKYIANFKKIVLRAVAKDYIPKDPFMMFKGKKSKPNKKPLSQEELHILENKQFTTKRLEVIRDIFVFQCYTGLAYSDVNKLLKTNIIKGLDGELWIRDNRRKTKSEFNVPLLPKALEIMEKYQDDPDCIITKKVLPVKSNQKMNEYLKEIAVLCEFSTVLNTHKARRTFGSTVTLANGVPIHVVKEMLGHQSVRQTEEYAITEQEAISEEMKQLKEKLKNKQFMQWDNNSKLNENMTKTGVEKSLGLELTENESLLVENFIMSLRKLKE